MTPAPAQAGPLHPEVNFSRKALVFVDIVESVRLMRRYEADVIERWMRFVAEVQHQMLPNRGGQLVKSYGDGLLLAFDEAPAAVQAALELQRRIRPYNAQRPDDALILLRAGVHLGDVAVFAIDLQGVAVNDAQRICSLAEPGETLVSAEVRDHLVPDIDPEAEDLGERFARHVDAPYRVYRIEAGMAPVTPRHSPVKLRPGIAVLPFECSLGDDPRSVLGEALADEINAQLAPSPDLHVIASLSTRGLKGRGLGVAAIGLQLQAAYVLSGRYRSQAGQVRLQLELADTRDETVLWAQGYDTSAAAAFDLMDPLAPRVANEMARVILARELNRALSQPLSTLENYTLLHASVSLMHRASAREFELAREMLEHLIQRLGRSSTVHAWMAKWHVLRAVQGLSADPVLDSARALDRVARALDIDPQNSLALAIGGLVHGYLRKDLGAAGRYYERALATNPNESLAWLFTATRAAYLGQDTAAAEAAEMALRLSPLDPMRYFYDSLAATAVLAAGQWQRAIELGRRSVRANRLHASTWRTLVYAQVMDGLVDEARQSVQSLLEIEPGYTVASFRERFPGRDGPMCEPWAQALAAAGLASG